MGMDVEVIFTTHEVAHLVRRFTEFRMLSAEKRLQHFDFVAPNMCSDEWRRKFRTFLSTAGSAADPALLKEVFKHSQLDVLDPNAVTGCHACREAFWGLVFLST